MFLALIVLLEAAGCHTTVQSDTTKGVVLYQGLTAPYTSRRRLLECASLLRAAARKPCRANYRYISNLLSKLNRYREKGQKSGHEKTGEVNSQRKGVRAGQQRTDAVKSQMKDAKGGRLGRGRRRGNRPDCGAVL